MIAMRYGTIPIVHATGGLQDTVFDPEDKSHQKLANGFVFHKWTHEALRETVSRALKLSQEKSPLLDTLRRHGMQTDFGWEKRALEYIKVFSTLTEKTFIQNQSTEACTVNGLR